MTRRLISTGSPFERTAGYSRAVVDGDWCFVAGTTGYDYATMTMPDEVETQAKNCLATISKALDEAGFSLADVVRARYYVTERADVARVYPILGEQFGGIRPAAPQQVQRHAEARLAGARGIQPGKQKLGHRHGVPGIFHRPVHGAPLFLCVLPGKYRQVFHTPAGAKTFSYCITAAAFWQSSAKRRRRSISVQFRPSRKSLLMRPLP